MNHNFMHGAVTVVTAFLLLIYVPMLVHYLRTRSRFLVDQPTLIAAGLSLEAFGVLLISGYRVIQSWTSGPHHMADLVTTISLAFVVLGGLVLIHAATLKHGRWKYLLVLAALASWTVFGLVVS